MLKRASLTVIFLVVMLFSVGQTADLGSGVGILAGYSLDPDQFIIGAQAIMGTVKGKIDFSPSVDFGFGNDFKVITLNIDGSYNLFSPPKSSMTFYVGAGPTIAMIDPEQGDGDTEVGLSLLTGLKVASGAKNFYNLTVRFGFGDIPEAKFLFGYMFGLGQKGK